MATTIGMALLVSAVPAVAMLFGSISVMCIRVPESVQAGFQMFSAGLLISAVAGELYPLLKGPGQDASQENSLGQTLGMVAGFLLGLLFMFGLARFTEGGEEEDDTKDETRQERFVSDLGTSLLSEPEQEAAMAIFRKNLQGLKSQVETLDQRLKRESERPDGPDMDDIDGVIHNLEAHVHKTQRNLAKRGSGDVDHTVRNMKRMRDHLEELKRDVGALSNSESPSDAARFMKDVQGTMEHLHGHIERTKFSRWSPVHMVSQSEKQDKLPFAVIGAVTVDAAVDGLLIGLSYSARPSAGFAMSIATCIEMGFLGLTFCAELKNATRSRIKLLSMVILPPIMLLAAGMGGYALGDTLHDSPELFVGLIAFSIVALLFLVTQELLSEAKEVAGDDVIVNMIFFAGLLGGILLEKVMD